MKPNSPNQSFFHPLDDVYVGSDARNETITLRKDRSTGSGVRHSLHFRCELEVTRFGKADA